MPSDRHRPVVHRRLPCAPITALPRRPHLDHQVPPGSHARARAFMRYGLLQDSSGLLQHLERWATSDHLWPRSACSSSRRPCSPPHRPGSIARSSHARQSAKPHLASGDALCQTDLTDSPPSLNSLPGRGLTRTVRLPSRQLAARFVERDGDDAVRVHGRLGVLVGTRSSSHLIRSRGCSPSRARHRSACCSRRRTTSGSGPCSHWISAVSVMATNVPVIVPVNHEPFLLMVPGRRRCRWSIAAGSTCTERRR